MWAQWERLVMSVRAEGNVCHILGLSLALGPPVAHLSFLQEELCSNAVCMLKAKDFLGLNAMGTTREIENKCLIWSGGHEIHSSHGW